MRSCLVIGGNGFIGSHIVDELVANGYEVGVFDRFSSGTEKYTATGVRAHVADLLDTDQMKTAMRGYDSVVHALSATTPATASKDPLLDIKVNVIGSVDLLRAAVEAQVQHVSFISSGGAIYGSVSEGAASERVPLAPISPYGIGKAAIESYLEFFRVTEGLDYTIFRVANAYGPRQQAQRTQGVIPIFLRRVLAGQPVTMYGDGSMTRDYIFVRDVASQIVAPLNRPRRHAIYNVGTGTATSVLELKMAIELATGREVDVAWRPSPPTFVDRSVLDVSRYAMEFTPRSPVNLKAGIRETWEVLVQEQRRA